MKTISKQGLTKNDWQVFTVLIKQMNKQQRDIAKAMLNSEKENGKRK